MYILPLSGLYNRFFTECAALKIVRWIGYQLEWDEQLCVYYKGEQPWCLPQFTQILWGG